MEFVSDQNFKVNYSTSCKKQQNKKGKKRTFVKKIVKNPIITITVIMLFLLSSINFVMIYSFMNILKTI